MDRRKEENNNVPEYNNIDKTGDNGNRFSPEDSNNINDIDTSGHLSDEDVEKIQDFIDNDNNVDQDILDRLKERDNPESEITNENIELDNGSLDSTSNNGMLPENKTNDLGSVSPDIKEQVSKNRPENVSHDNSLSQPISSSKNDKDNVNNNPDNDYGDQGQVNNNDLNSPDLESSSGFSPDKEINDLSTPLSGDKTTGSPGTTSSKSSSGKETKNGENKPENNQHNDDTQNKDNNQNNDSNNDLSSPDSQPAERDPNSTDHKDAFNENNDGLTPDEKDIKDQVVDNRIDGMPDSGKTGDDTNKSSNINPKTGEAEPEIGANGKAANPFSKEGQKAIDDKAAKGPGAASPKSNGFGKKGAAAGAVPAANTAANVFGKPASAKNGKGQEQGGGAQPGPEDDTVSRKKLNSSDNNNDEPEEGNAKGNTNSKPNSMLPGFLPQSLAGKVTVFFTAGVALILTLGLIGLITTSTTIVGSLMPSMEESKNDMCMRYDNEGSADSYGQGGRGIGSCFDGVKSPEEGRQYSMNELKSIMKMAGFNDGDAATAAAIAMATSSGDPNYSDSNDRVGLLGLQKNSATEKIAGDKYENIESPLENAEIGKKAKDEKGWGYFSKYSDSSYRTYLDDAKQVPGDKDMENDGADCGPVGGDGKTVLPVYEEGNAVPFSPFGPRSDGMHYGEDYSAYGAMAASETNRTIMSFADGVVSVVQPASGYGMFVVIDHNIDGQKISSGYGHMWPNDIYVEVGDEVRAGDIIALQGDNGSPNAMHLHFELHLGGWPGFGNANAVDPAPYRQKAGRVPLGKGTTPSGNQRATVVGNTGGDDGSGSGGSVAGDVRSEGTTINNVQLTAEQVTNIKIIIAVGQKMGFDEKKAILSALKISYNETGFINYGNYGGKPWNGKQPKNGVATPMGGSGPAIPGGSDYMQKSMDDPRREIDADSDWNSTGIFQQQATLKEDGSMDTEKQYWATWEKSMDPGFAAQLFFDRFRGTIENRGVTSSSSQAEWNVAASDVQGSVLGEGQAGKSTVITMELVDTYWDAAERIDVSLSSNLANDVLSTDTSPTRYAEAGAECGVSSLTSGSSGGGQVSVRSGTLSGNVASLAIDVATDSGQFSGKTHLYSQANRNKITDKDPVYSDCSSFVSWAYWQGAGIWYSGDPGGHAMNTGSLISTMKTKSEIVVATPETSGSKTIEDLKPADMLVTSTMHGSVNSEHAWLYVGEGRTAESAWDGFPPEDQVQVNESVLRGDGEWIFRPLNAKTPTDVMAPPPDQQINNQIMSLWESNKKW